MLEQRKTIASLLSVSSYIAAQMLADVASLKIALIPAGPIGSLSIDGGTFIYPLTFTLRDLVHKMLGKRAARVLIVAAAGINLFMAALFGFVSWLPPDPSWALQAEFAAILGPVWRIVIASIIAEVVSELLDTEVYHLWVTRVTTRYQWARVLTSNVISVPVDSLIFSWIAFGSTLPAGVVWSIFWSNVLVKGAVTLLSLPGIYLVPERGTS